MHIRKEQKADYDTIHALTRDAFAPMAFSDGTEADLITALRDQGNLTLSLVADQDGVVVGHVAFSPVTIAGRHDGWFGLGPIAVRTDLQKRGIGTALMTEGLNQLRAAGARGCALIGNPAVYQGMGFENDPKITYRDVPPKNVMRLILAGQSPAGELRFAPAFEEDPDKG